MTKKDFEAIAAAIATITDDDDRGEVAGKIGKVAAAANPRFDWQRWYVACNMEDPK